MTKEVYEYIRDEYLGWNYLYRARLAEGRKGAEFVYIGCFSNKMPVKEGLKHNQNKMVELRKKYYGVVAQLGAQ